MPTDDVLAAALADCMDGGWAGVCPARKAPGAERRQQVEALLLVGAGGFLGALARFLIQGWAAGRLGVSFPFGTLIVNVGGSFVLGLLLAFTAERVQIDPRWRLALVIGFLGSFTTFSTFTYETVQQAVTGNSWAALVNLLGNNLLGLAAVIMGIRLGRGL